jgi:predicted dehydrogenase
MPSKIKIAVIGTGWWATTAHIPGLLNHPQAEIVLVDPNPDALNAAASHYHVDRAYPSLKEALAAQPDIKGAIVAVPHHAHYQVGREVLVSGLHLLIEKPMTLYARDALHLIELADARGLEIMVGYFYPHTALYQEAR